jgi:RHS repeat-associated protein
MVVNKTDAVEQTTHYYPYGGVIGGIALNSGFQKYKFGGKELDRSYGLDWYDVQARQYDPVVPSWHTIDPLAEKYYCISPYAYCVNNPVMYFDPDGKWSWDSNGNLVAQKGDDVNTMANYLGTSSSNALQILDRCGIKANSEGILNLSAGQILNKTNLWVGTKSKNGSVVNNTAEAIAHYYLGNGKAADVGDQSTKELLSSEKFQSELNTITTTKVKSKGSFSVDMTDKTFHIGRTIVDYKITSNGTSNSVTFTLFANDGFWDPDFIDEKNLGEKFGIPFFQPDGMGPNLERGGTPYPYKTRSRTFFFKPTE